MQANTKPSFNNHEACMKKANKMKKSRSIKQFELDGSHELARQPGKPPPYHSTTKKKTTPRKISSPNYMKSTRSSEAKEGRINEASASSSVKLQWMVKCLTRSSSLMREMRMKIQSCKDRKMVGNKWLNGVLCENLDGKKATCSSKQKDSKFPVKIKLNPGATEAHGTSASKVCRYDHCSLNGLHHKPRPPLKRFLASRRRVVETKGTVRTSVNSPRKIKGSLKNERKDEFFTEIYAPEREAREPKQEENLSSVDMEEVFGERMGLELDEGQIFDVHCDIEDDRYISDSKKNRCVDRNMEDSYAEIAERQHFCDASSVAEIKFTQTGEEQDEELIEEDYTNSPHHSEDAGTVCHRSLQHESAINHGGCVLNVMDEVTETGKENVDSHEESDKSQGEVEHTGIVVHQRLPSDDDDDVFGVVTDVKLISSLKEASHDVDNNQPEFDRRKSNKYNADGTCDLSTKCHEKDSENDRFNANRSISRTTTSSEEREQYTTEESNKPSINNGDKLRSWTRCKKEEKRSEHSVREFNPRGPNFLPIEPDIEAEKVDLRHQEMDERRNAEEWMSDYALQKTVNQLASDRKKKVALLVEAFESVRPVSELQPHQKRDSSNYSHARARPIHACY